MATLLEKYKEKYGNVYMLTIKELEFIFRPLTRREYRELTEQQYEDEFDAEEALCEAGTLYPENYDFRNSGAAGVVRPLSEKIVEASGYADPQQQANMLDHYRNEMGRFDNQAETVISLVFQGTTPEEMQEWTQEKLMSRLARAEWVMKTIWNMPFEFGAREEPEEDGVPVEPPSIQEMGDEVRDEGGDPMVELHHLISKRRDAGYVSFPVIGGTKLLQNEEVLNNVREQIQKLSD